MPSTNPPFAKQLLQWFDKHGRHDLPWQTDRTSYRVWISEIMLQQTQVTTVIPYFERFMERFATIEELAEAQTDQVLHLWTGLGYYARARNLHKAAKVIVQTHGGSFPDTVEGLMELDGIGQSTAGAIAAISMGVRAVILDGNVKRVLARYHCISGWPEQSSVKKQLWEIAESLTPHERVDDYTQAIMDLGATVCTRSKPSCQDCPFKLDCGAHQQDRIPEFPGKKARKALPVKSVAMFILQNASGEVLLEKRPATGIWGSLYSLPESVKPSCVPKLVGASIENGADNPSEELEKIRHSFSHYHLDITPVRIRATKLDEIAETDRWLWYPLDHSLEVGLAAPVKKLLSKLAGKSQSLSQQTSRTAMSRMVHCKKYDKELPALATPPYPGPKGQEIFDTVSQQAWGEWQTQQTMLINEKQLNMMNADDRKYLLSEMDKFLNNEDFDKAEGYVPESE